MARDESWELAAPNEEVIAEMREHCHRVHMRAFDPALHVAYANHRRHEARVIYLPGGEGRGGEKFASWECLLCDPPQRFLLGLIEFSSPGSRQRWLRENPTLADEIRACEMPEELVGAAIEAHAHGEIRLGGFAEWQRQQWLGKLAKRRPKDAAREDGCMRFLLERRLEGLTVEKAIEGPPQAASRGRGGLAGAQRRNEDGHRADASTLLEPHPQIGAQRLCRRGGRQGRRVARAKGAPPCQVEPLKRGWGAGS